MCNTNVHRMFYKQSLFYFQFIFTSFTFQSFLHAICRPGSCINWKFTIWKRRYISFPVAITIKEVPINNLFVFSKGVTLFVAGACSVTYSLYNHNKHCSLQYLWSQKTFFGKTLTFISCHIYKSFPLDQLDLHFSYRNYIFQSFSNSYLHCTIASSRSWNILVLLRFVIVR